MWQSPVDLEEKASVCTLGSNVSRPGDTTFTSSTERGVTRAGENPKFSEIVVMKREEEWLKRGTVPS